MGPSADHWKNLTLLSPVSAILVGALLLFLGRKLFWLFVGAIGFVVGAEAAAALFPHQPDLAMIGGLVLGLIGAVIAIFVQKIAVSVGGFLAGGYFLMAVMRTSDWQVLGYSWVSFLVGGLIGAMLMIFVFDWALIVFSSISGAHLITHSLVLTPEMAAIVFAVLLVVGIGAQARIFAPRASERS